MLCCAGRHLTLPVPADQVFGSHTAAWCALWPLVASVYAEHALKPQEAPTDSLEAVEALTSKARQLELDAEALW